jgi:uncharacterized membrane protein YkgB
MKKDDEKNQLKRLNFFVWLTISILMIIIWLGVYKWITN